MADNVSITAGTGTTIAADECPAASGVLVQRTKTTWGPDGTANDVDIATGKPMPVQLRSSTGQALADTTGVLISTTQLGTLGQTTMSASVPVTIASNQTAVPVSGTFWQATQPVSGTVTVTNFGSAVTRAAGASDANTQRVTIDSNQIPPTSNFVSGAITTAMTGTTSTSLLPAPGVSLRNYITTIVVSNAHATVGTDVVITDGGTTLMTIPAAAVYGGAVITLPTPLRQPTTNTAIFCANVTTGSSTKVSAVGYTGA
jgi:hypothetical protein